MVLEVGMTGRPMLHSNNSLGFLFQEGETPKANTLSARVAAPHTSTG